MAWLSSDDLFVPAKLERQVAYLDAHPEVDLVYTDFYEIDANCAHENVLPAFEKEFDCKVLAQQGSTLGQISLLRASKEAPKFTVMFVDDLGVEIAKREGLIDPLPKDKMPNLAKVYPRFIYNDGYGVALMISSAGTL